jgi:hypothetical protein
MNIVVYAKTNRITPTKVNKTLLKAIVTGYMYKKIGGGNHTIDTIAEQEEKSGRYIVRIINI